MRATRAGAAGAGRGGSLPGPATPERRRRLASARRSPRRAISRHDPLAGALAVIADARRLRAAPPGGGRPRARRCSIASGALPTPAASGSARSRSRPSWWKQEGPPILAIEAASGRPGPIVWRRRRWRAVDPETRAETPIDAAAAAALMPRGYMIYPSLPERVTTGQIWRFAIFGARGDVARLLVAAAAATLAGLLIPVATSVGAGLCHSRRPDLAPGRHDDPAGRRRHRQRRLPGGARGGPGPAGHAHRPPSAGGGLGPRDAAADLVLPRLHRRRPRAAHPGHRRHPAHPRGPGRERHDRRRLLAGQPRHHADLRRFAGPVRRWLRRGRRRHPVPAGPRADAP